MNNSNSASLANCNCKRCVALRETEAALVAAFGNPKIASLVPLDKPKFKSNIKRAIAELDAANKVEGAVNRYLYLEDPLYLEE